MPLDEKMRLVLVQMIHPCCTITHPLTPIASCTQWALAQRYFPEAMDFMPLPRRPGFETGAPVDMDSIMLYHSSIARAVGAPSYPLLTARGLIINPGGNPDPNRAGLSRGDIERVMQLYPKRRAAARQASEGQPEKSVSKRWWSVAEEHETQPGDIRVWPPGEDGSRTITYCFENRGAYNFLSNTFAEALAKWQPAVDVSALVFAPDSACKQLACLCTEDGVAEVTLHVMLDEDLNSPAVGSLGYIDRIAKKSDPNKPRHYLSFPNGGVFGGMSAATAMAHELGKRHRRKASEMGPRDEKSINH